MKNVNVRYIRVMHETHLEVMNRNITFTLVSVCVDYQLFRHVIISVQLALVLLHRSVIWYVYYSSQYCSEYVFKEY